MSADLGRLEAGGARQQILARRGAILELRGSARRQRQDGRRLCVGDIIEAARAGQAAELIAPGTGLAGERRALPAEAQPHWTIPGYAIRLDSIGRCTGQQRKPDAGTAAGKAARLRPIAFAAPAYILCGSTK